MSLTETRIREIVREEIEWALRLAATRAPQPKARSSAPKMTPAGIARIARFKDIAEVYGSGLSYEETAKRCGCAIPTVGVALRTLGIAPRNPGAAKALRHHRREDERFPRMNEMREAGSTLEEIGAEFSITRERVRQIFAKHGLDTHQRAPTPEQRAAVDAYLAGENLAEAAARLDMGTAGFKGVIQRCGHVVRQRERASTVRLNQRAAECARLRDAGKSVKEIAEAMGFKHHLYVYRFLDRARGLQASNLKAA